MDWFAVRQLCNELLEELPTASSDVVDSIRESISAYAAVPKHEHMTHVAQQLRIRLAALSERRALNAGELAAAGDLAAQRAVQGIPIDAVIAAYQAGDQHIWDLVAARATTATTTLMPEFGRLMFAATSRTTEVMTRAHSRLARDIDAGRITLAHQFLELLKDPSTHTEAALAAHRLDLDPSGTFVGCVWLPGPHEPDVAYEAVSTLGSAAVNLVVRGAGGGRFEVLAQPSEPEAFADLTAQELRNGRLGIGIARHGLSGALQSLTDAHLALTSTTETATTARFAETWLESLVIAGSRPLRDLLQAAIKASQTHPHIAETVRAFAAADMSIATTAKTVHLHANTVTYRLARWTHLTGLDPRTFKGLSHSLIACQMADQHLPEGPEDLPPEGLR